MNLMPLAALLLSCLAVAISLCAVYAVRPRRRQTQIGGDGSTQLQSGGTLIIPADLAESGQEIRIDLPHSDVANAAAERIMKQQGRHL